ncbi:class II fructose-bisphosphatase [bacterium]|nr:class II fructose-bisphosphatase [bacterium]
MDRNLALECTRVTEAAAIACSKWIGRGDGKSADKAAVDAMRRAFNSLRINGTVVIGEGERDEAPMLYIGEKVGCGDENSPRVDIALDPLECTDSTAFGKNNALAVIAIAQEGCFLHAPDTYMEKIAVGPQARGVIDLEATPKENLKEIAKAHKCEISELMVVILERERHKDLIDKVRSAGAKVRLISDGDVSGAISTAVDGTGIHVMMGSGGAPEGVLAAAALRCTGGDFRGRLIFRREDEKERALKMGITDLNKIYTLEELAQGDVMFAATGVTSGDMLKGVRIYGKTLQTSSIVMRSKTGTIRYIDATHHLDKLL